MAVNSFEVYSNTRQLFRMSSNQIGHISKNQVTTFNNTQTHTKRHATVQPEPPNDALSIIMCLYELRTLELLSRVLSPNPQYILQRIWIDILSKSNLGEIHMGICMNITHRNDTLHGKERNMHECKRRGIKKENEPQLTIRLDVYDDRC